MEGPPPGTDLSDSEVPRILGINISTYVLAIIAVGLRFFARKISRTALWWDDWLMLSALLFAGAMCLVFITWMVDHGLGRHIWVAPADAAVVWAKGLFISEILYTGIISSIKFSLLCFYWRIFGQDRRIRKPIYILGAIVSCWAVAVILVTIFQCIPVEGFWEQFAPGGTSAVCGVSVNGFFDGNSIPNIITDLAIIILPVPFIWQLHLPTTQKNVISSIFILGFFVSGVSIARFTYIVNLDLTSPDITWNFVNVQIWTGIEAHIGIVCACLPSLRVLLTFITTGSWGNTRSESNHAGTSGALSSKARTRSSATPIKRETISDKDGIEDTSRLFTSPAGREWEERPNIKQAATTKKPYSYALQDMAPANSVKVTTDIYIE